MDLFKKQKEKREIAGLQLAPIIDVFIVIIIFLVLGSFSKGVVVELPNPFQLAKSIDDETVEFAYEVFLNEKKINFKFLKKELSISEFFSDEMTRNIISESIKSSITKSQSQKKINPTNLNFVIDQATNYGPIFDLSEFLRANGFENISYITEKEYKHENR